MRMAVAEVPQPQLIQHTLHAALYLPGGHFTQLQRIGHIVEHRFVRPQGIGLEHQAEVTLFGRDLLRGVPSYTVRLPMAIRPLVGFSSPATARSSVVFPLPEGPSSDTTSPGRASWTPLQHRVVAIGEMQIFYR